MITRLYLDPRATRADGSHPIRVSLTIDGHSIYFPTDVSVFPDQWDSIRRTIKHRPDADTLNIVVSGAKMEVDRAILLLGSKIHTIRPKDARTRILEIIHPELQEVRHRFLPVMEEFASLKEKEGTRVGYEVTIRKIRAFCHSPETLTFEDITPEWLRNFDAFLKTTSPSANARNIKMRNIRTIFNYAISNEITTYYPFKTFKLHDTPSKDRSLSVEEIRRLFSYPCEEDQKEYIEIFKLILYLGGINMGDLASLTEYDTRKGRVEFYRMKTGQFVSIGIQPEIKELLDKYRGESHLLRMFDHEDYKTYLHRFNDRLQKVGAIYNPKTKKWEGRALCPDISSYWARYSFASLAAELDIPVRTIGAALGHSDNSTVTSIYIRTDMRKKVDAAVRAVIDYIEDKKIL